jgi:hypothetical protein
MLGSFTWNAQSRMHSPQARPKNGFGDRHDFDELGTGQEIPIHKAKLLVLVVRDHGKRGVLESDQIKERASWMIGFSASILKCCQTGRTRHKAAEAARMERETESGKAQEWKESNDKSSDGDDNEIRDEYGVGKA